MPYLWLCSLSFGVLIGIILGSSQKIRIDKENNLIELSGSWIILILLMFIFLSKYAMGYLSFTNTAILKTKKFIKIGVIISSVPAGILVGRVLYYFYRYKKGPYTNLKNY
ncbi:MAG: hypothetical protein GY830_11380 [Bacteroidetes bacterium]|nr:hypothetical protein [Bacteroidota bacterium]